MELVGEGGGWSLGESGVGTKVRLDVGLNSRGEVLPLTDSKLLIRGTQGVTKRTQPELAVRRLLDAADAFLLCLGVLRQYLRGGDRSTWSLTVTFHMHDHFLELL